ncbi:MAG: biotin--[acetyl-CoA-carboxylase] ligase [Verrucomicrobiota bacterium]
MNRYAAPQAAVPHTSQVAGWTLLEFEVVDSTNFVAGKLGAWHAVRAGTQTAGRGRFQRSWISDSGGLWLSAVVPTGADRDRWQALPLVAGLAVIESLKSLGVASARLRWPNDIMVDERKLAGLLVDNFVPQLAVVGLGLNVANNPDSQDATLIGTTTRLADLVPQPPSLATLTKAILIGLRSEIEVVANAGFGALHSRINEMWGGPRRVTVDLDGVQRTGWFNGVDQGGRLWFQEASAGPIALEPHQVRLLREL